MSHLAIRIDGHYAAIKPDTSVDITLTNPYFNDTAETMSLPFTLPTEGNGHLFGNAEVIESDDNLHSLEKKVMDVEIEGVVVSSGLVGNIEDQKLQGEVGLQMVSAVYSLDDYLQGVRCRDVELIDKIPIGETIGNLSVSYSCTVSTVVRLKYQGSYGYEWDNITLNTEPITDTIPLSAQLPALGFSRPERCTEAVGDSYSNNAYTSDGDTGREPTVAQSYINVIEPYPRQKYHNARVSYMHYKKDKDGNSTDDVDTDINDDDPDMQYNPYLLLDANRPASGICFYVLYFLDCLFARFRADGVVYDNSALIQVDDLCRLSFFTTHCKFTTEPVYGGYGRNKTLNSLQGINNWLRTRNIETKIEFTSGAKDVLVDSIVIDGRTYGRGDKVPFRFGIHPPYTSEIERISYRRSSISTAVTADVMTMLASSQNFPDADAKEVLDSLWASFGIRFAIDQQTRVVKPIFIRDILTDPRDPIPFFGTVITATKEVEKVTGFRMQYSGTSEKRQREDNIALGVRDYDTVYDYQDYRNLDVTLGYSDIIRMAYDTNETCYVDFSTGNVYRVKIDSEADERKYYHPVIFEVRQLGGVEIGDCSDENQDFVYELTSSFQPVIPNDVNFRFERSSLGEGVYSMKDGSITYQVSMSTEADRRQLLTAFVSEEMWHENIERKLSYPLGNDKVDATLDMTIKTRESYDVSSSKDGDSPLQNIDWGLAVTIMRGGGYDAGLDIYDGGWDMMQGMQHPELFGCSKYRMKATSNYAASFDSIDCYSELYDYNGSLPGVGDSGSVLSASSSAKTISGAFVKSNADLLSPQRKVSFEALQEKGWHMSNVYGTYFTASRRMTDIDGTESEYLYTVIQDDGTILTPDFVESYMQFLETGAHEIGLMSNIYDIDAATYRILVGRYDNATTVNQYAELLNQLGRIYYSEAGQGSISCTIPQGVMIHYYDSDKGRFSLKIRSYAEAPHDVTGPGNMIIREGEPMCDPDVARRGLFDTFMSEFAHFVMHRKKVVLQVHCQISALQGIQWMRRYHFGDYVGWINSIHIVASAESGLDLCEVELYVL